MYDYSNMAHINKVQILYIIKDQKINVMLKYIRLLMLNISVCLMHEQGLLRRLQQK